MDHPQRYSAGAFPSLLCEATGTCLRDIYLSVPAIVRAHRLFPERVSSALREAVGAQFARPRLPGLGYVHVSALGAPLDWPLHGEPKPRPILSSPEEARKLREPDSYLDRSLFPLRRRMAQELAEVWGEGLTPWECMGGMHAEGPVTTAVLLAGQDFLTWPYDCPEAARELIEFCARSMVHYVQELAQAQGQSGEFPAYCLADDFAGMLSPEQFREFVVPAWNLFYEGLGVERRIVHTELLRPGHLPVLPEARIASFDPGADQHVSPEQLRDLCPCDFHLRILSWHYRAHDVAGIQELYRHYASFHPVSIQFGIESLAEEEKYLAVLEVARELAGES